MDILVFSGHTSIKKLLTLETVIYWRKLGCSPFSVKNVQKKVFHWCFPRFFNFLIFMNLWLVTLPGICIGPGKFRCCPICVTLKIFSVDINGTLDRFHKSWPHFFYLWKSGRKRQWEAIHDAVFQRFKDEDEVIKNVLFRLSRFRQDFLCTVRCKFARDSCDRVSIRKHEQECYYADISNTIYWNNA